MRRAILVLLVLLAAWLAAASVLFLVPRDDRLPRRADAVVVLAGDADHRLPAGRTLVASGIAPILAVSREPRRSWQGRRLCRREAKPGVVCFSAEPYSTRGEARTVARLARERGWRSLVVVTSGYHVVRARMLFRRCLGSAKVAFDGVGYDRRWIPLDLVFETAKLVRAETVERGC